MYTDLFSSLDGCFSIFYWLPSVAASFIITNKSYNMSFFNALNILKKFTQSNQTLLPLPLMVYSIMLLIIFVNISGLSPFVYSPSSSLWFTSTLALLLWGLLLMSGFFYAPKYMLAHLAPSGSPAALVPFLVLIETVSILIRPLTLTVRLIANITAGHIILSLIAIVLSSLNFPSSCLVFMISIFYYMFEVFVCIIQAYIFTLLIGLYSSEH